MQRGGATRPHHQQQGSEIYTLHKRKSDNGTRRGGKVKVKDKNEKKKGMQGTLRNIRDDQNTTQLPRSYPTRRQNQKKTRVSKGLRVRLIHNWTMLRRTPLHCRGEGVERGGLPQKSDVTGGTPRRKGRRALLESHERLQEGKGNFAQEKLPRTKKGSGKQNPLKEKPQESGNGGGGKDPGDHHG